MAKDKSLAKVIQTPAISALIVELDRLGYEMYIRPKPIRTHHKELIEQLQKSLTKEPKTNDNTPKKGRR